VDCDGVIARLGNARARQHVVELVQKRLLPPALHVTSWKPIAAATCAALLRQRRNHAQELHVMQRLLAARVAELDGGLRGVGAAMQLKVELAAPHG
jgi:hypothetical protein